MKAKAIMTHFNNNFQLLVNRLKLICGCIIKNANIIWKLN